MAHPTEPENLGHNEPGGRKEYGLAARLGAEYGVSASTIKRDGHYAAGIDLLTARLGSEARAMLLGMKGKSPLTQGQVIALSMATPDEQEQVLSCGSTDEVFAAVKALHARQRRPAPTPPVMGEEAHALAIEFLHTMDAYLVRHPETSWETIQSAYHGLGQGIALARSRTSTGGEDEQEAF